MKWPEETFVGDLIVLMVSEMYTCVGTYQFLLYMFIVYYISAILRESYLKSISNVVS